MRRLLPPLFLPLLLATEPNAATKRWWAHAVALANDGMQGRDTGSDGYNRASAYVATQFARLGIEPAGTLGYFQPVPLRVVRLAPEQSRAGITRDGGTKALQWFRQITVPVWPEMAKSIDGGLVFVGTDLPDGFEVKGKIVVTLGTPRFIEGQRSYSAKIPEGAAAMLTIPSEEGPEPARWPVAYSVSMTIDGPDPLPPSNRQARGVPAFTFNPAGAELLFEGSGHSFAELLALAKAGKPVPSFTMPSHFGATLKVTTSFLASDNIIGILPGTDPKLAGEHVVVSAHLDGYGVGEPWNGDAIYNGAFDDAAYVATLLDMVERWRDEKVRLKRPVVFCIFTGEEKGLLGSRYFAGHPSVARDHMIANLNLDILRPIFPLKILTLVGSDRFILKATAKDVAAPMGIRVQEDPEPLRGLLRRSDHYNFEQIGVPALGFVFGYEKGSPEEALYRRWYLERYHTPADDLKQPWLPEAAAKFNEFYKRLVERVANFN